MLITESLWWNDLGYLTKKSTIFHLGTAETGGPSFRVEENETFHTCCPSLHTLHTLLPSWLPIRLTNKNPFVNNEHVSSWNAWAEARGRGCFHAIDFRELPRLSLPLPTVAINLGQVKLEHCIECKLCKLCNQSLACSSLLRILSFFVARCDYCWD